MDAFSYLPARPPDSFFNQINTSIIQKHLNTSPLPNSVFVQLRENICSFSIIDFWVLLKNCWDTNFMADASCLLEHYWEPFAPLIVLFHRNIWQSVR